MRHNYNNIFAKYKNFPSLNIKVVCDMLQMLCGHKKLSKIEVRGRGTGEELDRLIFLFTFSTIYRQDFEKWEKNERISQLKSYIFHFGFDAGTFKQVLKHRSMNEVGSSQQKKGAFLLMFAWCKIFCYVKYNQNKQ